MGLQELAPELFDIISEGELEEIRLQGTEFLCHDFRYKFFNSIDFDQCVFNHCDMRETSIWLARFGRCAFFMVDFSGTQLSPMNRNANLFTEISDPGMRHGVTKTMGDEALATFTGSNFLCVNFSGSFYEKMDFRKIEFEDCNFAVSTGIGANFGDAVLRKCIFNCSNLNTARFRGARLSRVKFVKSILDMTDFQGAYLLCCNLNETQCNSVVFRDAKLGLSKFENVVFRNCNFKNAELIWSNFKGAKFKNCLFENTKIGGCKLEGADFGFGDGDPWSQVEYLAGKGQVIVEGELRRK